MALAWADEPLALSDSAPPHWTALFAGLVPAVPALAVLSSLPHAESASTAQAARPSTADAGRLRTFTVVTVADGMRGGLTAAVVPVNDG